MSSALAAVQTPAGLGADAEPPWPAEPPVDAVCPLCGAPLDPAQEWCLSCGAAARTRLAPPTNWKAPIAALAAVMALALGVLAAALVDLSDGGSSGTSTPAPVTTTITIPAATPTPGATGGLTSTTGGVTTGALGTPSTATTVTPGGATSGGAINPGTPTTIKPSTTGGTGAAGTGRGTSGINTTPAAGSTPTPASTTTPASTSTGSRGAEEALSKAGFKPRSGK